MPDVAQTLREIAADKAKKRPELVDYITEDAPILDVLKWIPASHGLWNVEEVMSDVTGPQFVDLDSPLPDMNVSTGLTQTYVQVLGGKMKVGEDKADQFGGHHAYFAKREPKILRKAGMDTEVAIFRDFWRKAAIKKKAYTSAGGTGSKLSTIIVAKFDELNTGIYDPKQFTSGRLINWAAINGGNLHDIGNGVMGYAVRAKGRFGWQLLAPEKNLHAIVNIDIANNKLPTLTQLEEAIDAVRGKVNNTMILGHYSVLRHIFSALKMDKVQYANSDSSIKTLVGDLNGIKLVGSYNVSDRNETAVA
jgi:hypothetical protein